MDCIGYIIIIIYNDYVNPSVRSVTVNKNIMSNCIIIIKINWRTFTADRPPYPRAGYLTGNFRKLWPRCAFNSNDQCILFTTPAFPSKALSATENELSQLLRHYVNDHKVLYMYPIHHARISLKGFVGYGNRYVFTPSVLIETRVYTQVAAYLQIHILNNFNTITCKLWPAELPILRFTPKWQRNFRYIIDHSTNTQWENSHLTRGTLI